MQEAKGQKDGVELEFLKNRNPETTTQKQTPKLYSVACQLYRSKAGAGGIFLKLKLFIAFLSKGELCAGQAQP